MFAALEVFPVAAAHQADFGLEIVRTFKRLVHRGESQISNLVERPKWLEHRETDFMGRDLRAPLGADGFLHLLGEAFQRVVAHIPPLARAPYADNKLVAVKRLTHAVSFHHGQHGLFNGGESPPALGALSTPPNSRACLDKP